MDLISVIIPVYNTDEYLDTCIESVVRQTFKNLEIILVDDGSNDSSPRICDEWAAKDERIRVIHKSNGGQGEARNYGVEAANGTYIGFVDSDDVIVSDMYEKMYDFLTLNNADMVQCSMFSFSEYPLTAFPEMSAKPLNEMLSPEDAVKILLSTSRITSTCPNVLIRKDIADRIPFDTGMINEDVMWLYRAIRESSKIVLTDEQLYGYYQREGSTMNAAYSDKRFDALKALNMRAEDVRTSFPSLYPLAERSYAGVCMYHYQTLCRNGKSDENEKYKRELVRLFRGADLESVFSVTDLKYKVWYSMFKTVPDFTCRLRNFLKIGM